MFCERLFHLLAENASLLPAHMPHPIFISFSPHMGMRMTQLQTVSTLHGEYVDLTERDFPFLFSSSQYWRKKNTFYRAYSQCCIL